MKNNNYGLTKRELEVLELVISGLSNTEIALKLYISPDTSKHHVSSIINKFNVKNRVQVVVKAIKEHVVWYICQY